MTKSKKIRLPRYKKAKNAPSMQLTDRDKQIVEAVFYQLKFLTRDQIKLLELEEGLMIACQRKFSLFIPQQLFTSRLKAYSKLLWLIKKDLLPFQKRIWL